MESINDFRTRPTGTLRVNTSEGAARLVPAAIVFEFLRRYPEMKVDIVTEESWSISSRTVSMPAFAA